MKYFQTLFLVTISLFVNAQYHFYISNWYVVPDTTKNEWSFSDVYDNNFPYHPHTIRINGNNLVNTIHLFFDLESYTLTTSYIEYDGYEYDVSIGYISMDGVSMYEETNKTFMVEMLDGDTYLFIDDYNEDYNTECTPQFIKENVDGSIEYIVKYENKDYFGKKSLKITGLN